MFKLVVEPINGIQVGLVYVTLVHYHTSKWQFKTAKLTSSVESASHPRVSSIFDTGTCLLKHSSQAGITQRTQGNILGVSVNTWMHPPLFWW